MLEPQSDLGEEEEALAAFAPRDAEIAGCILTEATCSGALERFARTLAGRAAITQRAAAEAEVEVEVGEEPSPSEIERALRACADAFGGNASACKDVSNASPPCS